MLSIIEGPFNSRFSLQEGHDVNMLYMAERFSQHSQVVLTQTVLGGWWKSFYPGRLSSPAAKH